VIRTLKSKVNSWNGVKHAAIDNAVDHLPVYVDFMFSISQKIQVCMTISTDVCLSLGCQESIRRHNKLSVYNSSQ